MVLDPLSALSVAAAVVQFVQFATDLVSKSRILGKSPAGTLIEYAELSAASHRLIKLDDELKKIHNASSSRHLTEDEAALLEVAHSCSKIASEFKKALDSLKVAPGGNRYKSFRQALKTIWHAEGIARTTRRLDIEQQQLVVHLLVVLSNSQTRQLEEIREDGRDIEANILKAIDQANSDVTSKLTSRLRDFTLQLSRTTVASQQDQIKSARETFIAEQHNDIDQVSFDISSRVQSERTNLLRDMILAWLYFPQVHERRSQIHPAHAKTFSWIFDPENLQRDDAQSNFKQWLEDRQASQNVFWISGKPGSGKSTLMRYLWESPQTRAALSSWSDSKPVLYATCFFWLAGTKIQRSLQGLLRSLLHDLLQQDPATLKNVMPLRWLRADVLAGPAEPWSNIELTEALQLFINITASSHHICIFVDGLDEFEGDFQEHQDLVTFLIKAVHSTHVKLCVSSRPYPVFQRTLRDFPQLRLELLTRDDIKIYVENKLGDDQDFQALQQLHPQPCSKIVEDIVDRAQGVFLWVYLVVRWLIQGITESFSAVALLRRLREIPPDLDEFFQRIIDNIPVHERQYAAMYFNIKIAAPFPPPLLCLYWVEEEDPEFIETTPLEALSVEVIEARQKITARRLESRCRGLLEATRRFERMGSELHLEFSVQFLHRCVRDFLLSKESQLVLDRYSPKDFSSEEFLCKSTIALLKTMRSDDSFLEILCREHLQYARTFEESTQNEHCALYNTFVSVLDYHRPRQLDSPGSRIGLALFWRLELCAISIIRDEPSLDVHKRYVFPLQGFAGAEPDPHNLLDLCFRPVSEPDRIPSSTSGLVVHHLNTEPLTRAASVLREQEAEWVASKSSRSFSKWTNFAGPMHKSTVNGKDPARPTKLTSLGKPKKSIDALLNESSPEDRPVLAGLKEKWRARFK